MAEGNVLLCGCPNCQRAVVPTPQAAQAGWYQCTRCGLFYQSHHGCGCALAAAEARERALREALEGLATAWEQRKDRPEPWGSGWNEAATVHAQAVRAVLAEEGSPRG